jgi:ketosteroid isomerase-like protein
MKKYFVLIILAPFFVFSQSNIQIQKKKKALWEKQIVSKKKKTLKKALWDKKIIKKWEEYSKAFEYADFEKIASYFTYPLTVSLLESPQIIENKKELISFYKKTRNNVQEGYKYSALDKSKITWLSKDVFMIDATYSRYNKNYKKIFQGRGLYMYKKIADQWKMFSIFSLPIPKKKVKKSK